MSPLVITLIVIGVILIGAVVLPLISRQQFKRLPFDQQIRILMQQARGLIYFKNISYGKKGTLIYIKNKRKILTFPWVLMDGKMLCIKDNPFDNWDYPEDKPALTDDEKKQALEELEKFNNKSIVKIYFKD